MELFSKEELMYSPADSHVNHSVKQENERAKTMIAFSGTKCYEQYEKFNRHGLSLKMLVDYLLCKTDWYSSKCVLKWKKRTMKFNRLLFQLAPSMLPIEGIEYG